MWLYLIGIFTLFLLYFIVKQFIDSLWPLFPTPKATKASEPIFDYDLLKNPPKPVEVEFDTAKRDAVLKNSFNIDKVPKDLDAIVVGSGLGGLTTAALLAKAGKRVLVLEQHDQAGGCCHVYAEKGFEFDVGIHYVGRMNEGTFTKMLTDQISGGKICWEKLDEVYDILAIGKNYENRFDFRAGANDLLMNRLIEKFPNEEAGIRKVFKLCKMSSHTTMAVALLKMLPKSLSRFLIWSGLLNKAFPGIKYLKKSLSEVLDENFKNDELKAIFSYSFGDYGTPPSETPFLMQCLLVNHFAGGGYYPRGGASEIAYNIIPTIESSGGRVLVRAMVTSLLFNGTGSRVIGVKVRKGQHEYELFAPLIISDAGIMNTYLKLTPPEVRTRYELDSLFKQVKPGLGLMSVFIGLEGTAEELGVKPQNVWAFKSPKVDTIVKEYMALSPEEARVTDVPLLFLSFPSAKDPTFNTRYPGKTTCAIITITPYEWFEDWKDEKALHRGEDYKGLKMDIANRMWHQVLDLYPQLEGKLEYIEVGTPLSNQYYLNTIKGEVYGLDHDIGRFDPSMCMELRPQTPIQGLYLTGQDMFTCGYSGAMAGGILCACSVLERNLFGEIEDMRKVWRKINDKKAKKD